jgi:dipeptide/tripeptide permease
MAAHSCTQPVSQKADAAVVEGYTPEQVEEVRMVVRLLPVFFTTILYWTVYAQMGTFFIMQARRCSCFLFQHTYNRGTRPLSV